MVWVTLLAVLAAAFTVLFVLFTDGRYFGKILVRWFYDHVGPRIFGREIGAERWRELIALLGLVGDEAVLDVGTAAGGLPLTMASRPGFRGRVMGLDWSPGMIAAARAEAARRGLSECTAFEVADVRDGLPCDSGAFDVVICLGLLDALSQPAWALAELRRMLRPGGLIVLSLYQGWSARHVALARPWYEQQLAAQGFVDLQVLPWRRNQALVTGRLQAETP